MKRFLFTLMMIGLMGVSYADINRALGEYNTSADWTVANTTLGATNELGAITFESGSVVDYRVQVQSGNVRQVKTPTLAASYLTIVSGDAFTPNIPVPLAKDTTFYFYSVDTAPATVEVWYSYR